MLQGQVLLVLISTYHDIMISVPCTDVLTRPSSCWWFAVCCVKASAPKLLVDNAGESQAYS
jgi:hypothetical protein